MTEDEITSKAAAIGRLIEERLGVKGRDLQVQLRRAGRLLPRRVARDARYLAEAAAMAPNPRLLRRIDGDRVQAAHHLVAEHLGTIDPRERRMTRLVGVAAVVAFDLLVVAVLVALVLRWRGFL